MQFHSITLDHINLTNLIEMNEKNFHNLSASTKNEMKTKLSNKTNEIFLSVFSDPMFSSSENFVGEQRKMRTISDSSAASVMSNESVCFSLGVGPLWWF